ncbi:hypothetical protein DM02DRAFT_663213, partial [Periconia macrospinosa]
CPNINIIKLKTFKPLNVLSKDIKAETQNIKFSFAKADAANEDPKSLALVWINGQNQPIVKSLINPILDGDSFQFEASLPYDEFLMNGLTISAVVKGSGPFASIDDVAKATLLGPGLIEIN